MTTKNRLRTLAALAALLFLSIPSYSQEQPKEIKQEQPKEIKQEQPKEARQEQSKEAKKGSLPAGTPVLWKDPGDISARNLLLGPGGGEMKPDLSSVTFMEEETGGYSPKFRVRDGAGRVWMAKLGKEAQPETVAARLTWAVGYVGETNYLVPCVQIKGAPAPQKEVDRCEGQGFANVRFEARPENVKRLQEWGWQENPFAGTREFKGLIVLMGLINNWDLKDSNNKILYVAEGEGGQGELRYIISDLGATFGKTGNFITHNRNEPKDYAKSKFVEKIEGQNVIFSYDGKNTGLFRGIMVEDAKWIGGLLAKLSNEQIQDAFKAANYKPEDVRLLSESLRARIDEIANIQ